VKIKLTLNVPSALKPVSHSGSSAESASFSKVISASSLLTSWASADHQKIVSNNKGYPGNESVFGMFSDKTGTYSIVNILSPADRLMRPAEKCLWAERIVSEEACGLDRTSTDDARVDRLAESGMRDRTASRVSEKMGLVIMSIRVSELDLLRQ
jgi:hypothetical protein